MIKNDFNVLKWLFDSINDSFKENKSSLKQPITSYLISLEIIETLSAFYSLDDKITLNDLPEFILNTLEGVVEDLNHLIDRCPNYRKTAFIVLSIAYRRINDYVGALRTLTKALQKYPKYIEAYVARGQIYIF